MSTIIKDCTCEHVFQDARYGKGKRVWNEGKDGKRICTVCGTKEQQ